MRYLCIEKRISNQKSSRTDYYKAYSKPKDKNTAKPAEDVESGDKTKVQNDIAGDTSQVNKAEGASVSISEEGKKIQEEAESASEEESATHKGKVGVNVGKTARKIAAAKTKNQLRAVMAEIKGDMQEVKAGIEKGWCDESEMDKVNSLM